MTMIATYSTTPALAELLRRVSAETDRAMSAIVREALRDWLRKHGHREGAA